MDEAIRKMTIKDLREQLRARGCNPGGGIEELRVRLQENIGSTGGTALPAPGSSAAGGGNVYSAEMMMQAAPSAGKVPPGGASQISFGGDANQLQPPSSMGKVPPGGASQISFSGGAPDQPSQSRKVPPGGASQMSFGSDPPPAAAQGGWSSNPSASSVGAALSAQQAAPPQQRATAASYYSQPQESAYGSGPSVPPAMPSIVQGAMNLHGARTPAPYGTDQTLSSGGAKGKEPAVANNNYARPGGNQNLGNKITGRPSSKVLAPPGGHSQISFG